MKQQFLPQSPQGVHKAHKLKYRYIQFFVCFVVSGMRYAVSGNKDACGRQRRQAVQTRLCGGISADLTFLLLLRLFCGRLGKNEVCFCGRKKRYAVKNSYGLTIFRSSGLPITRRGFTGHEHYPELNNIINMNGRLYDPKIGRFFSPDNFVQDASCSQDFNRYSYARNCPLKYVDPTGQLYVDDLIEVDNTGRITITTQAGRDIVRTPNGKVRLSGNGVFRTARSEYGENAVKLTGLSRDDANSIFNLLGDHTRVEWGKLEVTNANGGSDFYVGSSRHADREELISDLINRLPEGSVQRYDHSHPSLHNRDVENYRYSTNDVNFWNVLISRHPNASAGIRSNGHYDLYYRHGVPTDKYNNPLFQPRQ